jgi:hypothetical protein
VELNLCNNRLDCTNKLNYMAFRFQSNFERMSDCRNSVAVVERAVVAVVAVADYLEHTHLGIRIAPSLLV